MPKRFPLRSRCWDGREDCGSAPPAVYGHPERSRVPRITQDTGLPTREQRTKGQHRESERAFVLSSQSVYHVGYQQNASIMTTRSANPLQCLIRERLRERGWSYGEIARRGALPRSTVYNLAKTRNLARPPRSATIDALARGLDMPVSVVRAAAAESTGLHYYDEAPARPDYPGDRERQVLIARIDELSPEDRRCVAALVESLWNKDVPKPADP